MKKSEVEKKGVIVGMIISWILVILLIVCVAYCFRRTTFLGTVSAMFLLLKTNEVYRNVKRLSKTVAEQAIEEAEKKEVKSDNVVTFGFDMRG